jgi:hypothetical protein
LLRNLKEIDFDQNYFVGTLPVEITALSDLEFLGFEKNGLTGSIPVEIGRLTKLLSLDLSGNALTGSLPAELASATEMFECYLGGNNLNGTLPTEYSQLQSLEALSLEENLFHGSIPTEYGNLTSMKRLWLEHNMLVGPIPSQLGRLSEIEEIYLFKNDLTGTFPVEFEDLLRLTTIDIHETLLTGDLDPVFCNTSPSRIFVSADCMEPSPEVTCSCCTKCCSSENCVTNTAMCDSEYPMSTAILIDVVHDELPIVGTTVGATSSSLGCYFKDSSATFATSNLYPPGDFSATFATSNLNSPAAWYRLEPGIEGEIFVTTCSNNTMFDTVVSIYRAAQGVGGDCMMDCVAFNDDYDFFCDVPADFMDICSQNTWNSALTFVSQPSDTYYITVESFYYESGEFDLTVLVI